MSARKDLTPRQSPRFLQKAPSPSVVITPPTPLRTTTRTGPTNSSQKKPPSFPDGGSPQLRRSPRLALTSSPQSSSSVGDTSNVTLRNSSRNSTHHPAQTLERGSRTLNSSVSSASGNKKRPNLLSPLAAKQLEPTSPRGQAQQTKKRASPSSQTTPTRGNTSAQADSSSSTKENLSKTFVASKSPSTASPYRKISRIKSPGKVALAEVKEQKGGTTHPPKGVGVRSRLNETFDVSKASVDGAGDKGPEPEPLQQAMEVDEVQDSQSAATSNKTQEVLPENTQEVGDATSQDRDVEIGGVDGAGDRAPEKAESSSNEHGEGEALGGRENGEIQGSSTGRREESEPVRMEEVRPEVPPPLGPGCPCPSAVPPEVMEEFDSPLPFCDEAKPLPKAVNDLRKSEVGVPKRRRSSLVRGRRSLISQSTPPSGRESPEDDEKQRIAEAEKAGKSKETREAEREERQKKRELDRIERKEEKRRENKCLKKVEKDLESYGVYLKVLEKEEKEWTLLWNRWSEDGKTSFRDRNEPLPTSSHTPKLRDSRVFQTTPDYAQISQELQKGIKDWDFEVYDEMGVVRRKRESLGDIHDRIQEETDRFVQKQLSGMETAYSLAFELSKLDVFEPNAP